MQYLVLRDCYVGEVFRRQGDTVELPDDLEKSEKNFTLIGGEPGDLREPSSTEYRCSKCSSNHKESSKLGKRHLKYRQAG